MALWEQDGKVIKVSITAMAIHRRDDVFFDFIGGPFK